MSSFSLFLIVVVIIYANVDHILLNTILLDILHCNQDFLFFTEPIVNQATELLPCINKFQMKNEKMTKMKKNENEKVPSRGFEISISVDTFIRLSIAKAILKTFSIKSTHSW